jgi:predicted nucleotidyltransferase component of viral defense system
MLQTQTVLASTLDLLKKLMAQPELKNFALAGGTSLSLQIGHRISVDLDFFGNSPFETDEMLDILHDLGNVKIMKQSRNILITNVNDVKVDFVNYRYPILKDILNIDGIRLLSTADISAMKFAAVAGRGRKRDFIDIFFLLKEYSLKEMMAFYNAKYFDGSEMMVARSLTYFDDADGDEDLELLKDADWDTVKKTISKAVNNLYK